MLSNEDVNLKLATLTGEMSLISAGMSRMERALDGFVVHSRTINELVIQHQHQQEAIAQVRADNAECSAAHLKATSALAEKLSATTASVNEIRSMTRGAIMVGGAVSGFFTVCVFAVCSWIFNQVSKNTEMNTIQQQRLEQLERSAARRDLSTIN